MIFSDEDLKRLNTISEILDDECICPGEDHNSNCPWFAFKRFRARLEAAERIVIWAHGICPDTMEEAWRKACGGEK